MSISGMLPIQTCWPGDVGPLVTWPLVITRGPAEGTPEPRHLPHAGHRPQQDDHALAVAPRRRAGFPRLAIKHPGERYPVAVALGADPATILAAVTPIPDTLSEYAFAGLLRGRRPSCECFNPLVPQRLQVPATAESCSKAISNRARWPTKVRSATTPATTTRWSAFQYSRSMRLRTAKTRSITAPTPGARRMNRPCWAWR
jgi:hypothetical protein